MEKKNRQKASPGNRRAQRLLKELRESRRQYYETVENLNSGVAVCRAVDDGQDFIFVDFNRAGERIESISRDDVVGRSVLEVFPGVKESGLFEVFQRVWRTGKPDRHPVTRYRDDRISGWPACKRNSPASRIPGHPLPGRPDIRLAGELRLQAGQRRDRRRFSGRYRAQTDGE